MEKREKVEFIESYIKIGNTDYQWNDNHGELIRCKDCKHYTQNAYKVNGVQYGKCNRLAIGLGVYIVDNWYCAYGERRQNNG